MPSEQPPTRVECARSFIGADGNAAHCVRRRGHEGDCADRLPTADEVRGILRPAQPSEQPREGTRVESPMIEWYEGQAIFQDSTGLCDVVDAHIRPTDGEWPTMVEVDPLGTFIPDDLHTLAQMLSRIAVEAGITRAAQPEQPRGEEARAEQFGLHPQRQRAHKFPLMPIPDPPNAVPGKQWYACERCGAAFSEAYPTMTSDARPCEPAPPRGEGDDLAARNRRVEE